jgi:diguanylate cyclase (GGDEF)-like protein
MSARILLIDDSVVIHELVELALAGQGYTLAHADDAQDCCALVRDVQPDLILLDVNMPGIDGFEACRQLQADPATQSVPIIFLTGQDGADHKVAGLELGAVDYVSKPFHKAELLARVRTVLRIKLQRDSLAQQALTDALTGLGNRAAFERRMCEAVAVAQRYGRPAALVMIDLDHFKRLNDTFGHSFGDRVLRALAGVLRQTARETDIAFRYGGEEFAVLLTETSLEQGLRAAERIRAAIAAIDLDCDGAGVQVTASLGIAATTQWPDTDALTPPQLVSAADGALYQAKHGGRNQVAAAGFIEPLSLVGASI